jgi:predicted membrane protein
MSHVNQIRVEKHRSSPFEGRCIKVVHRFVGVDEVDCKKKIEHRLVQIKIDCDSGGDVMVDIDDVVLVGGNQVVVVKAIGDKTRIFCL